MKSLSISMDQEKESSPGSVTPDSDDLIVQSLLKQCKELETLLARFNLKKYNSHKSSGILKSNLLRTSLLTFLRSKNMLAIHFVPKTLTHTSLLDVVLTVLVKWWTLILANLNCSVASPASPTISQAAAPALKVKKLAKSRLMSSLVSGADDFGGETSFVCSPIPVSDRHAYLECISRIISRSDWMHADPSATLRYQSLMTQTLEGCIDKMTNLKSFLMATAAFTGKVFAYSFFALPGVSDALLFLLNVRQATFKRSLKSLDSNATTVALDHLRDIFPSHLHHLIDYRGLRDVRPTRLLETLNCLATPHHPVPGIQDPNAGWVRRWCNCDSNVYNSFFKHYIDIMHRTMAGASPRWQQSVDVDEHTLIYMCPGFTVINAHIYQVMLLSLQRMANGLPQKAAPPGNRSSNGTRQGLGINSTSRTAKLPFTSPSDMLVPAPLPTLNDKQFGIYYASIIKHFRTLRYIVYNTCTSTELMYVGGALVGAVDRALIALARETSIHDHQRNGLILSISLEFFNYINGMSEEAMQSIDWEFWLSCVYMMVRNADLVQVLLKNFSFLFNIWDVIPNVYAEHEFESTNCASMWLKNSSISIKGNFVDWIISDDVLTRFFSHWNPAVRSYYMRFVIWRAIGANNALSLSLISTTHALQAKLDAIHAALLRSQNSKLPLSHADSLLTADCPFVNRRFCIVPINAKDENGLFGGDSGLLLSGGSKANDLRKTSPYEIFDEAVYTCSSPLLLSIIDEDSCGEVESALDGVSSSKSLVATLGKFFKNWGPHDEKPTNRDGDSSFKTRVASHSSSSIDRLSNSSTPSLSSFGSVPTSRSYSTIASSLNSDTLGFGGKLVMGLQAPECFRNPPELARPILKFDVTWDQNSIQQKHRLIVEKNRQVLCRKYHESHTDECFAANNDTKPLAQRFPSRVQIPLMAVTCESGQYAEFQVDGNENSSELDFDGPQFHVPPSRVDERQCNEGPMKIEFDMTAHMLAKYVLSGRGLNEFNALLDEFINHVDYRIQNDRFNPDFSQNYADHLRRIYPFLAVDCSAELRLLNAA